MEKVLNSLLNNLQSCLDKNKNSETRLFKKTNNDFNRLKVYSFNNSRRADILKV